MELTISLDYLSEVLRLVAFLDSSLETLRCFSGSVGPTVPGSDDQRPLTTSPRKLSKNANKLRG
ncbi:hypothetical protein AUH73_06215 [archaeon 13_1_40CM_4_53_4]|nr:MAG: hypothetical protein AUI07_03525 [archaeon 13_2_20CM_2_53_6]OLC61817.1 MAG: hypothetical protein AUH73_06215 [archaeon 13_1_40CM_4_53_4]OLE58935.1 MAG: hypothetical protein AUG17_05195 [Crenarchaeota archaeon 13_1_20CM_2_53_14]